MKRVNALIIPWLLVSLAACAGPEPLLRSNKHVQLYGKELAQQDIDGCRREAEAAGLRPVVHRSGNAATGAVLGATLGGAIGASAGLIGGGAGVAIGAAAGGGLGLIIGLVGGAYKPLVPEQPYADAVVNCLIKQGYEVTGWD
jgi:outer membrane lipoprotein SlyB